jgi:hypothetical protein
LVDVVRAVVRNAAVMSGLVMKQIVGTSLWADPSAAADVLFADEGRILGLVPRKPTNEIIRALAAVDACLRSASVSPGSPVTHWQFAARTAV